MKNIIRIKKVYNPNINLIMAGNFDWQSVEGHLRKTRDSVDRFLFPGSHGHSSIHGLKDLFHLVQKKHVQFLIIWVDVMVRFLIYLLSIIDII